MKIISPGKKQGEMWPYDLEFHCYPCGCRFQIEPGDKYRVKTVSVGDQREDGDWAHVACPNCGKDVTGTPREWGR